MATQGTDASFIERRLLELAYTTDAKITVTSLAYFTPCTIEEAGHVLDDLAARDRLSMEIEDDGTVVYQLAGRQRLAVRAPEPRPLAPMVMRPHRYTSPTVAAILTALIPGAGHLYAGRVVAGVLWFLVVGLGYALILPGLVLHLFAMASAAHAARERNLGRPFQLLTAG